ncbi:hypothetical protein [Inquilinus limosus]|uniref:hypothetical protein n=1 Tax=Inquilinus limosus TaxID=171674 RepID=UPI000400E1F1|nr:hypothetical protein [Inquilinus limosus]
MTEDPCIWKLMAEVDRAEREALLEVEIALLARDAEPDEIEAVMAENRRRWAVWRAAELPKAEAWVRRRGAALH